MTQSYMPFDAGAGANVTEDGWRKMARLWLPTGALIAEDNELEVFADSTGMQVKVRTGKAWVRGHYYESDAVVTVPLAAAHATLARTDRIVLRADFTGNTIVLGVVQGTNGGGVPSLTQSSTTWEVPLAQVSVPAADTSIDAGQVTDDRDWSFPIGKAPMAWARRAGSPVSVNDAAWTAVTMDTETFDNAGMFTASSASLTCRHPGIWRVGGVAAFDDDATGDRAMRLVRNGVDEFGLHSGRAAATTGVESRMNGSRLLSLSRGDTVRLEVWQNSGGALDLLANFEGSPAIQATWERPS